MRNRDHDGGANQKPMIWYRGMLAQHISALFEDHGRERPWHTNPCAQSNFLPSFYQCCNKNKIRFFPLTCQAEAAARIHIIIEAIE